MKTLSLHHLCLCSRDLNLNNRLQKQTADHQTPYTIPSRTVHYITLTDEFLVYFLNVVSSH